MNRALAERRGVPFVTFAFAHNTVPSRYYPPDGFPRLRGFPREVQYFLNRWFWRIGNFAVDTVINLTIARRLKARGLPLVKDFFSKPAKLVMVGVSPGLMKPPFRLNARFRFVGYCRWQAAPDPKLEREVVEFTAGAPVPVLTFGSMVYQDPQSWMRRFAAAWPRDRKIIVQRGWSGFEQPPDCPHIKVLGAMSHDHLFEHASVVVHHGGAGTTASVLHAGRPHVVVPHIADQNFFAHEVVRLGCGIKLPKKSWPEKLAAAVASCEADPAMQRAAVRAREILSHEDGPRTAVAEIERFVRHDALVEELI
jgi:vancomycin aglycone glucosyltransferase